MAAAAFSDWLATSITCWSLFSFAVYLPAVAWYLAHVDWRATWDWNWPRDLLRRAFTRGLAALPTWQAKVESSIDASVRKLIEQRKRGFSRSALLPVGAVYAIMDVFLVGRSLGLLQREQAEHPAEMHMAGSAGSRVAAALMLVRKNQPGKAVIMAMYVFAFGSLLITLYSHNTGLEVFFDRVSVLGIRVLLCLLHGNVWLTVFFNAIYVAVLAHRFAEFASADENIAELGVLNCILQEVGTYAGLVFFHLSLLWRLQTEARSTIDAKKSSNLIAGLRKLLHKDYDVVVELDSHLTLTEDGKDLSGVLFLDSRRSLRGTPITNFLVFEHDREVFSTHVMQPSLDSNSQCAAIPHVFSMRDSCGNVLRMELWHTLFEDVDSQRRHLIGIKELADDNGTPPSPRSPSAEAEMPPLIVEQSLPTTKKKKKATSQTAVSDDEQPRQGHIDRFADQENAVEEEQPPQEQARRKSDGDESDAESVSSARSGRSRKNMLEGFRPTSALAMHASTLHLLGTWNVTLPRMQCCSFHALLKEATKTNKWLANTGCQQFHERHEQTPPWQCPNCGIISPSAEATGFDPALGVCFLCRAFQSPTQIAEAEASSETLIEM